MAKSNYLHYNIIFLKIAGLCKFETTKNKWLRYFCRIFSITATFLLFTTTWMGIVNRGVFNISSNGLPYACLFRTRRLIPRYYGEIELSPLQHNFTENWRIFSISILTVLSGTVWIGIMKRGVLEFSANALSYSFLCGIICALQRAIYYFMYDEKLKNLLLKMNEIFKYKTETLLEERSVEGCLNMINKLTFTWLIYAELFILMFCLYPLYTKLHKDRTFPIVLWVPYDSKPSPFYELTYFVETACLLVTTFLQTSMDMFFVAVLLLTAEQFKILGLELKNLLFTKLVENGVSKEIVSKFIMEFSGINFDEDRKLKEADVNLVYDICYSEKFNDDVVKSSKKLINFHQSLLLFCADLEDFFSPMMLFFFSFLMITALFLNFVVASTKDVSIMLQCLPINLAIYFDLFVPCFFANVLTTQVETLRKDAYELPWYILNKKFKINFIFVLHKMNVPIGLTLGKFSILGLSLFLWAIKTINSYVIVLYQFYQTA